MKTRLEKLEKSWELVKENKVICPICLYMDGLHNSGCTYKQDTKRKYISMRTRAVSRKRKNRNR